MKNLYLLILALSFFFELIKNQITISSPNELTSLFNCKKITSFSNYFSFKQS